MEPKRLAISRRRNTTGETIRKSQATRIRGARVVSIGKRREMVEMKDENDVTAHEEYSIMHGHFGSLAGFELRRL